MSDQPAEDGAYYDPYDFEIDTDPYPVWKRLRDEAPLYRNDKHDFYALSRFADVQKGLIDWKTFSSAKGSVLELIKSEMDIPPGSIIFEDPPTHPLHRGLLSRVFSPRRVKEIEPMMRRYCAEALDAKMGSEGFDFIADLGAYMPMRTIGLLLGIPEEDQEAIREQIDASLRLDEDMDPEALMLANMERANTMNSIWGDYIDSRIENPSDDLMSELVQGEYEDLDGTKKHLTREEVLGYVGLLAGAGNETTTRLIGWAGKLLAEHPDQRQALLDEPDLIPNAVEELLRYEPPSPVQARYVMRDVEYYGETVPEGSVMLFLNASANRDEREFEDPDRFDVRRRIDTHLTFGYGIHFCLGANLARLEGQIALDEVLKRFPTWEVDWDHAKQARTSTVRGWERLPVLLPRK
jgi:cytochrome P450